MRRKVQEKALQFLNSLQPVISLMVIAVDKLIFLFPDKAELTKD